VGFDSGSAASEVPRPAEVPQFTTTGRTGQRFSGLGSTTTAETLVQFRTPTEDVRSHTATFATRLLNFYPNIASKIQMQYIEVVIQAVLSL
jgi:hypothetical protein